MIFHSLPLLKASRNLSSFSRDLSSPTPLPCLPHRPFPRAASVLRGDLPPFFFFLGESSGVGGPRRPPAMAPPVPPPERVAESATPTPADAQRSLPTPFLTKTYQLVDDPAIDDLISWNEDGSTFVVWRPAEFARDLLPKYFKHNNFSSFVRQLNTYGFRKIVPDRWEFANDCFRRGEKRLLCDIQRRKIQTPAAAVTVTVPAHGVTSPTNSRDDEQAFSSNSSPVAAPDTSVRDSGGASSELVEDNHRLKKENERLKRELSQIKNLCNSVLLLMSKYASQQRQHQPSASVGGWAWGAERPPPPPCPLELMRLTRCSSVSEPAIPVGDNRVMPDDDDDDPAEDAAAEEEEERGPSPRLFGVHIGIKRLRGGAEESAEDEKLPHRRVVKVKLESVDPIPSAVEPPLEVARHRWRTFDGDCRPSKQRECN